METLESVLDAGNPSFPSDVMQQEFRLGIEALRPVAEDGLEGRAPISRPEVDNFAHDRFREGGFWEADIGLNDRWRLQ